MTDLWFKLGSQSNNIYIFLLNVTRVKTLLNLNMFMLSCADILGKNKRVACGADFPPQKTTRDWWGELIINWIDK